MAKVKKTAFGGMGSKPAASLRQMPGHAGSDTPRAGAPNVAQNQGMPRPGFMSDAIRGVAPAKPGFRSNQIRGAGLEVKPLPPGSIGMPGGPGGKTMYNTGPMPKGGLSGGPIGTTGFKNIASENFQTGITYDMKKGGKVSSASKRADGIAQRGKTRA